MSGIPLMQVFGIVAEVEKMRLDINSANGNEVQDIVKNILPTPPAIVEETRHYLE